MPAPIKESEVTWLDRVKIRFGISGFTAEHAIPIMRATMQETWPTMRRPTQCVYVIRLVGEVAIDYPGGFSPAIYIGEGKAYGRLYQHANWLASLVASVPQVGIEVRVAEVARRNHDTLYQYIEADLLRWFAEDYSSLPWFNRQRERGKESQYDYEPEAERSLRRHLGVGAGNAFLWAIKPTHNNQQYDSYAKGISAVG
jgi:hypothetical protein